MHAKGTHTYAHIYISIHAYTYKHRPRYTQTQTHTDTLTHVHMFCGPYVSKTPVVVVNIINLKRFTLILETTEHS